jgi:hypothetical protein
MKRNVERMKKLPVLLLLALFILTGCSGGDKQTELSRNMIKHLKTKGYVLSEFQNEPKEKWDSTLGLTGDLKIESMDFMKDEKIYKVYLIQYKDYKSLMDDEEESKLLKGAPSMPFPEFYHLAGNIGEHGNYYLLVFSKRENEKGIEILFKTIIDGQ